MFNRNANGHSEIEESEVRWRSATVLDEGWDSDDDPAPASLPAHEPYEPRSLSQAFERPAATTPPVSPASAPSAVTPLQAAAPDEIFILVHRPREGRTEVYECTSETEMENLIAEFVSLGENQTNFTAYLASPIDVEINMRPQIRLIKA